MLERLNLADQFSHISTDFWCHNFHRADIKIGIDQESSPDINTGFFIVNAINATNPTPSIREQWERNAAFDHL